MNATATYQSQNKGTQAGTDAFHAAVARVQQIATLNQALTFDMGLMDYLAARVETHAPEARAQIAAAVADTGADLEALETRLAMIESEAARTFLVVSGVNPSTIAPSDFPTIVRAYVVARAEAGHTFTASLF